MAGDLWFGTRWIEFGEVSWIGQVAPRFKQVLVVLGNHCYWPQGKLTIKNGANKCNALLQDMGFYNVKVLDKDTYLDGDVLYIGCTLWTDMNNGDPLAMYNMPMFMSYDGKISYENGPNGQWSRFTSQKWVNEHYKHVDYIRHVAAQNRDKKLVVITHHIPLLQLCDPNFVGNASNAYYNSDLSELILSNESITHWVFGHTHYTIDTMFEHCRMLNNSFGYLGEHREQEGLVKHEVLEVNWCHS